MAKDKQLKIINGPEKYTLVMAWADRRPVTFELEGGDKITVRLTLIGHEDGSGVSFLFDGETVEDTKPISGYYRAHEKATARQGFIADGWSYLGK